MKKTFKVILYVISCIFLAISVFLLLITLSLISGELALNFHTASVAVDITGLLPQWLAYQFVLPTPFGGVFRSDFVIVAAASTLVSWIFNQIRKAM